MLLVRCCFDGEISPQENDKGKKFLRFWEAKLSRLKGFMEVAVGQARQELIQVNSPGKAHPEEAKQKELWGKRVERKVQRRHPHGLSVICHFPSAIQTPRLRDTSRCSSQPISLRGSRAVPPYRQHGRGCPPLTDLQQAQNDVCRHTFPGLPGGV